MALGFEYFQKNKFKTFIPKSDPLYLFTWLIIFGWVFWFIFSFHRGRHLFIIFVILSIYIALILNNKIIFKTRLFNSKFFKVMVYILFSISSAFHLSISIFYNFNYLPVAVGIINKDTFLDKIRPSWKHYKFVNNFLKKEDKVLHLFGHRQFYLKKDQFYPSPYFQGWIDWTKLNKVDDYYNLLKKSGFTHVIGRDIKSYHTKLDIKDSKIQNIISFNRLNFELLKKFGTIIYNKEINIPNSRTFIDFKIEKRFVLYKLK